MWFFTKFGFILIRLHSYRLKAWVYSLLKDFKWKSCFKKEKKLWLHQDSLEPAAIQYTYVQMLDKRLGCFLPANFKQTCYPQVPSWSKCTKAWCICCSCTYEKLTVSLHACYSRCWAGVCGICMPSYYLQQHICYH